MSELSKLPNIGKVLEENLLAVGIETPEQLREIGVQEAFRRIRSERDPGACLHMLYGIQGAILGIPDKHLSADIKQELKAFFHSLQKNDEKEDDLCLKSRKQSLLRAAKSNHKGQAYRKGDCSGIAP